MIVKIIIHNQIVNIQKENAIAFIRRYTIESNFI